MPLATLPLPYPETPRVDQIDEYFGTRVADPYRWLEEVDSPQTQRWIGEQNELAESVLGSVPQRRTIRARLTEVWDYERRSVPEKAGDLYAYFRNAGLQNQAVLYVTRDLAEPGRVLLDPNTLSPDGTVALTASAFSDDGARFAYSVSTSGSDWQEWHVRDVATGKDLPDIVRWSKFSGASSRSGCRIASGARSSRRPKTRWTARRSSATVSSRRICTMRWRASWCTASTGGSSPRLRSPGWAASPGSAESARTGKRSTATPATPSRRRSTATTWRAGSRPASSPRRSGSTSRSSRASRCSTPRRTARACQ